MSCHAHDVIFDISQADTRRVNKKMFSFDPRELHGGGGSGVGTGSGLGLSLAKMIAEAHGGHSWVQSEGVDKGAVLALGLPLSTIHKMTHPPSSAASRSSSFNHQNRPTTITLQDREIRASIESSTINTHTYRAVGSSDLEGGGGGIGLDSVAAVERDSHPAVASPPVTEKLGSGEYSLPPPPLPRSEPPSSLHVLVVEDSAVARLMLVKMLKSLKCTTEEAEDGAVAVRMVQATIVRNNGSEDEVENTQPVAHAFDLILCDSVMPNLAGPEAVKQIRAMGFTNPILGVTGNTLPEQVEDFIAHGVNDVLSKPVKLNVLKEELARHVKVL